LTVPFSGRASHWCTGQVTIHCPVHRTGYYSLSCAPDRLLFTVLCTGQATIHCHVHQTCYYSLSCAPDMLLFIIMCAGHVTIHYPVHRTCYYSLSCAPDSYYSLSCAPANSTLSAFSSILSSFDCVEFLSLRQACLAHKTID
jgi:hypothetical protein